MFTWLVLAVYGFSVLITKVVEAFIEATAGLEKNN